MFQTCFECGRRGGGIAVSPLADFTPSPNTRILAKNMLPKYAIKWGGSYGVEIPWNKGISTENVVHEPTFTPYELRLLWHTDPPCYAI